MAAPTFVAEYETVWNTNATPKTTAAFNAQAGDVLVCFGMSEDQAYPLATPTNTQGALTWSPLQSVVVSAYSTCYAWAATVDAAKTGMTVSVARTGAAYHGINVLHYRDTAGVGTSAKANASGAPSVGLTTAADSAVVVAVADWNAADGASRTWRTVGVAATEQTYYRDAVHYTVYAARHSNAGAAGAKTAGLSAPSGLKYSIIAVEVLGVASEETPEGTGTVTVEVGLTGTGKTLRTGTGSVQVDIGLTGTGHTARTGAGTTDITVGLTGAGVVERSGTGSTGVTVALTGTGQSTPTGSGSLALTIGLTGTGSTTRSGTGSVGLTVGASGAGAVTRSGTGSTTVTVSLTGTGITPPDGEVPTGTGHVDLTVTLAGVGRTDRTGTSAVDLEVAVTGAGRVQRTGTGTVGITVALDQAASGPAGDITIVVTRLWAATATRTVYTVHTDRPWEVSSVLLQPPA